MLAHQTLPLQLTKYINYEKLKIKYQNFDNIFGALINKKIHIKKAMSFYKQRFTIAHEVGHYFHGTTKNIDSPFFQNDPFEKEADNYAMEQLLPKEELEEKVKIYAWTLSELEVYFGVEKEVIEKRIRQIIF